MTIPDTKLSPQTRAGTPVRTVTEALISRWLEHERGHGASPNTLQAYRRGLQHFVAWLATTGQSMGAVTPAIVTRFKMEQAERYSVQTVNLRLSAVRAFYRFAVVTGRIPLNPAAEVKGLKRPNSKTHRRDALTGSEVLHVLDVPDTGTLAGVRDKAILALMTFCALRAVEVHRANVGDLHTRNDRLTLDVQGKGRTEKDAYVVLPMRAEGTVRAWLAHRTTFKGAGPDAPLFISLSNRSRGARLALRSIRHLVKRHYRAAGVVGATKTTHSLRHSAITNAIRNGASPMQVQSMARHASFDTTLGYFHEVSRLDDPAEDLIAYDNGGG
jgi:integrase/recombinase XerD